MSAVPSADSQPDATVLSRPSRPLRAPSPAVHQFTTADGTALRLTRYAGGPRGPVVLGHGLGVSSRIFSTDTIQTNLVEFLAEAGYDVWLLDFRSSIEVAASATRYSGDDIASQDWPAALQIVRRLSGAPDLQVLAHCWGSVTFTMAMLGGHVPEVRAAVLSQVSAHVIGHPLTRLKTGLHLPGVLDALGVESLTAYAGEHPDWRDRLYDAALRLYPVEMEERCPSVVCRRLAFMYSQLFEHDQLAPETHDQLHELFGVANISAFEHLARMSNVGHVVGSGGEEIYLPHLDRMRRPIRFIHGAENACFAVESTGETFDALQAANGPELYSRDVIPDYGHIDCIFGKQAARDVFPRILEHFDTH